MERMLGMPPTPMADAVTLVAVQRMPARQEPTMPQMKGKTYFRLTPNIFGTGSGDREKIRSRPDETFVCINPDHTLSFIGSFGRMAYGSGTGSTCGKTLIRVEYGEFIED